MGRYLSEPGQEELSESEYFKALRAGELERIVGHGLQYFPIFQEYSTKLTHFTVANARRHAKEAQAAARRLGVPPTVIYFAVDYDATDPEVTSHILPYFRALNESLGGSYRVGIYASRNICTRVKEAGYASGIFVSDMSTGFSGNLGFPIPDGWVFDQFSEISGYRGKWDLDRVAYSGMQPACDAVMPSSLPLNALPEEFIDLVEALEDRFTELRRVNRTGAFGKDLVVLGSTPTWVEVPTWRCVLNYLAKSYLKGSKMWALSAEAYRDRDAAILEGDSQAQQIIAQLDQWIAGERRNWIDPSGGEVDIAHMCVTTLGYINTNPIVADKWTGWAGDLASALGPIQAVVDLNPTADVNGVARALVGQKDDFTSHEGLRGLNLPSDLPNNCNYADLCSDGDAIAFARILESVGSGEAHSLSQAFRGYYNNPRVLADRFKQIAYSVGAMSLQAAESTFESEINKGLGKVYVGLLVDGIDGAFGYGEVKLNEEVKKAACRALATFIF